MKFIDPSFINLYTALTDNKKLENIFIKNHILYTLEDYYNAYGYDDTKVNQAKNSIKKENERIYKNLTNVLLDNIETIKQSSIQDLVISGFLKNDIELCFDYFDDMVYNNVVLQEIFYTVKYCYTSCFFQNNYENFLPQADFREIEKNPALNAFIESIMIEFDKLDNIIYESKKFNSYNDIPYEYINYITQLVGLEQKNFMILEDQKQQYITLAENILELYSIKGSYSSFELIFNLLGYNINLKEYYFDRRLYYSISKTNSETKTINNNDVKFYLTTIDPRKNLLTDVSINEIVTDKDISTKENIKNFNELVEKYGVEYVLGYKTIMDNGEKYTGPVYKYFFTNYVDIEASFKFSDKNPSLDNLYQLKTIVDFFIPKFKQRNVSTTVSINTVDDLIDSLIHFENEDGKFDYDFIMLDSEEFSDTQKDLYIKTITKDEDGKIESVNVITNNGLYRKLGEEGEEAKKITYFNSVHTNKYPKYNEALGKEKLDEAISEYQKNLNKVGKKAEVNKEAVAFYNPISEKIKRINSSKYVGSEIRTDNNNQDKALYKIYRPYQQYKKENDEETYTPKESESELYLPRDYNNVSSLIKERWDNLSKVSLNNIQDKNSLRNQIEKINHRQEVICDKSLDDIAYKENNEDLLSLEKISNFSWIEIKTIEEENDEKNKEEIRKFAKMHNVINFDYINNDIVKIKGTSIKLNSTKNNFEIANGTEDGNNILQILYSPYCYIILENTQNQKKYTVYKYTFAQYKLNDRQNFDNPNDITSGDININIKTWNNVFLQDNDRHYYITIDEKIYKITPNLSIELRKDDNEIDSIIRLKDINKQKTRMFVDSSGTEKKVQISNISKESEKKIGNFYYDKEDGNCIKQYVYPSIKGNLYFYRGELYKAINNTVYKLDDGKFLGIKKIDEFPGRLFKKENDDKYYIYEYNECYKWYLEEDDNDNFILINSKRDNISVKYDDKELDGKKPIEKLYYDSSDDSSDEFVSNYMINDIVGNYFI